MLRSLLLLGVALAVGACGRASGTRCGDETCGGGTRCDSLAQRCVPELPSRCSAGTQWSPGQKAFREATATWGLDRLAVEGVRLSTVDFDGDGYADLSARRSGSAADDFTEGGARQTWLLHNDHGSFSDVTAASGFARTRDGSTSRGRVAEVVAWADVDNDGDLDAFTGMTGDGTGDTSEIMLNAGDGTFEFAPASDPVRLEGFAQARASAAFVDFDRDGVVDLWVGNGAIDGSPQQNELLSGLGGGQFEDVTEAAGLATSDWVSTEVLNRAEAHTITWGVAACDLNGDGVPELLASSYGRAPNHLWQGSRVDGEVRYTNQSIESGYAFDDRVDWTDNESARCYCKLHRSAEDCANVPAPRVTCRTDADILRWDHAHDREPYRLGGNSGTTVCADVNGDGAIDLLTSEIVHWDVGSSSDPSELLVNAAERQVRFTRPGNASTGLQRVHDRTDWNDGDMTAAVFDFDNDGLPDVLIGSADYPGTRAHLWWQRPDGHFEEVPIEDGIDHLSSHGVAVADFDRDGDLDVILGHSRNRCADQCYPTATTRFFENVIGSAGNWVQLNLVGGAGTNRAAIGARVELRAAGRMQAQEVGGGHGHYGVQHDLALHFGLGTACEAEVTVYWPDAARSTQRFTLQAGYRYRLEQGGVPVADVGR